MKNVNKIVLIEIKKWIEIGITNFIDLDNITEETINLLTELHTRIKMELETPETKEVQ